MTCCKDPLPCAHFFLTHHDHNIHRQKISLTSTNHQWRAAGSFEGAQDCTVEDARDSAQELGMPGFGFVEVFGSWG